MKNAIHPGYVHSNDGDRHYISYRRLIELYGLDPKTCIRWETLEDSCGRQWNDYQHYYPDDNGKYRR